MKKWILSDFLTFGCQTLDLKPNFGIWALIQINRYKPKWISKSLWVVTPRNDFDHHTRWSNDDVEATKCSSTVFSFLFQWKLSFSFMRSAFCLLSLLFRRRRSPLFSSVVVHFFIVFFEYKITMYWCIYLISSSLDCCNASFNFNWLRESGCSLSILRISIYFSPFVLILVWLFFVFVFFFGIRFKINLFFVSGIHIRDCFPISICDMYQNLILSFWCIWITMRSYIIIS